MRHRSLILDWKPIVLAWSGLQELPDDCTIRLASGLRFAIAHSADAWTLVQVFGRNDYRVQPLERWSTVIDIGANIGAFSVRAARAAPGARIYSYEPSPETCQLLRRNMLFNGVEARVSVNECAVGSVAGDVPLISPPQSSMRSLAGMREDAKGPAVIVRAVTLADIFERHAIASCDLLKIDCEGAEYAILRACPAEVFDRTASIALEFHEWSRDQDHHELVELLERRGFHVEAAYDPVQPELGYIFASRRMSAATH